MSREMVCPVCGQYIDVTEIEAEAIEECINVVNKYHNHTIYHYECVNALEKLKEQNK